MSLWHIGVASAKAQQKGIKIMTTDQRRALIAVIDAIVETVRDAGPLGAPAGPMYAALMAQGATLQQFESLMGALVRAGKLVRRGNCYHVA